MSTNPVLRVSLDAALAFLLSVVLLIPMAALVTTVSGWQLPVESDPFATAETIRFTELEKGAADRLVEAARRAHPRDRISVERLQHGDVIVRRIGRGGPFLLPLAGKTPGIGRLEGSFGPLWADTIAPLLPDVSPDAPASEQVAALVTAALRFLDEAPSTPAGRALERAIQLGMLLLFVASSLGFLIVGAFRVARGAIHRPLTWRPIHRLVGLGLLGGMACLGGGLLLQQLFALAGLRISEQPAVEAVLSNSHGAFLAAVALVLVAPLAEELFFRAYVFRFLLQESGRRTAYTVSVLLFAGLHLHPVALAIYAVYGLVFAWLTERTSSFLPPVVAHVTVNATALLVALF